jgi:VIT family
LYITWKLSFLALQAGATMTALEFGIVSSERSSSVLASLMSGDVFAFGALPSVVPFAFSGINPISGLIAVAVITLTWLLVVGVIKSDAVELLPSERGKLDDCLPGRRLRVLFDLALREWLIVWMVLHTLSF